MWEQPSAHNYCMLGATAPDTELTSSPETELISCVAASTEAPCPPSMVSPTDPRPRAKPPTLLSSK